jgi:hypothetical protein
MSIGIVPGTVVRAETARHGDVGAPAEAARALGRAAAPLLPLRQERVRLLGVQVVSAKEGKGPNRR